MCIAGMPVGTWLSFARLTMMLLLPLPGCGGSSAEIPEARLAGTPCAHIDGGGGICVRTPVDDGVAADNLHARAGSAAVLQEEFVVTRVVRRHDRLMNALGGVGLEAPMWLVGLGGVVPVLVVAVRAAEQSGAGPARKAAFAAVVAGATEAENSRRRIASRAALLRVGGSPRGGPAAGVSSSLGVATVATCTQLLTRYHCKAVFCLVGEGILRLFVKVRPW